VAGSTPADPRPDPASSNAVDPADPQPDPADPRAVELAESLAALRQRIEAACGAAGRDPGDVRLLAVTKTFPAADVVRLADLGLAEFGENKDQEAAGKVAELAAARPDLRPRWHMVGRLQRNKARSVAGWAARVQSVDSVRLADALDRAATAAQADGHRAGPLEVLVQASVDGDPDRGGCPLADLPELADRVESGAGLRLAGLMGVAPLGMPAEQAFEALAGAFDRLLSTHPSASELSCGMSADLEAAISFGSTCVRVGTALLGGRRLASD
jgi:pyridoxal phosphate enzyme (YggS family)